MKISLVKILNRNKDKYLLNINTFKGYKVINGVKKPDRVRESLGLFLWVNPKGAKQKQHNKEIKVKAEKLKLIQIGVQYIVPRLKQVEEVTDEPPRQFQIEVITSRSQLSEKTILK